MTSNWNVTLTHYDVVTTTETNITGNFISLPMFTDTGSGEVNSARLVLGANKGIFLLTAPLIDEYDRIRIVVTDGQGGTYDNIFDIIKIIPSHTKTQGTRITLILLGMEHHLQKINYIKPHFFEGAAEVIEDIGQLYEANRGTLQPVLSGFLVSDATNALPDAKFQNNVYPYGVNEETCFARMNEVSEKQGGSVDAGGALDFFDTKFAASNANFTDLVFSGFSSGNPDAGKPDTVITATSSVNVGDTEGGIDSRNGTLVCAWGSVDQGSLPTGWSQFKSQERRFDFYPLWDINTQYETDSKVQDLGLQYVTSAPIITLRPPLGDWVLLTRGDDYGNQFKYSPWTATTAGIGNGGDMARNSGCDPTDINSSLEQGPGFNDCNLIINDNKNDRFRTWANIRISTATPDPSDIVIAGTQEYLYGATEVYRGFRVLIDGTGSTGGWSGLDINNVAFDNSIVEYDGDKWIVLFAGVDNLQCGIRHESVVYEFNGTVWASLGADLEGECFHPYTSIISAPGIPGAGDGTFTFNLDSAVRVRYDFDTTIIAPATDFHRKGAWFNIMFPFPNSTHNAVTGPVGVLYGGANTGADEVREPATVDTNNMHLTHDGFRGFNNNTADDFGQINAIAFWSKLAYFAGAVTPTVLLTEANFKMRCTLIDTRDNVVVQDFVIAFNDHWDEYVLPISGFQIYRGIRPIKSLMDVLIPPKKLSIQNQFFFRDIKMIIIQTQESYDGEGRYVDTTAFGNRYSSQSVSISGFPNPFSRLRRLDLFVDGFRFVKPLFVTTGQVTLRDLEPLFIQRPEIGDYFQLKNDAFAELEKANFRHVEYDMSTSGKIDIDFGDFFDFQHPFIIPDNIRDGQNGTENFVTLVAKRIEYSITKPSAGKGGFLRRIHGVKRFVA